MNELTLFDYGQLGIESRIVVKQRTEEIKTLVRRSAQDIIDIGNKLIDVKERLGHGGFGGWLDAEFGWAIRTAQQFMLVADKFKNANFAHLDIGASALYLLAAPSTPEPARIEAIERAQAGEEITYTAAKTIVAQHRTPEPAAPPAPPSVSLVAQSEVGADSHEDAASEYEEIANDIEENGYEWSRSELIEFNDATEGEMKEAERELVKEYRELAQEDRQMLPPTSPPPAPPPAKPHVANNSGNNEWYTPAPFLNAARRAMGNIDLDPASCEIANEVVQADEYYDITDDGLSLPWAGRIWLNPPYAGDLIGRFVNKLITHIGTDEVTEAIVLINNATETAWFQDLAGYASAVCFPKGRIRYWNPDREDALSPLQGQAIVYIGPKPNRFRMEFLAFGVVL